jgi:hypothetical protein
MPVPDHVRTAAVLVRLRQHQRDATAAALATALRQYTQRDGTARTHEQVAADVEAGCLAQFRAGSELDAGLHALAHDALAATHSAAVTSRLLAAHALQHVEQEQRALLQQDALHQLAQNHLARLQQEHSRLLAGRECVAALDAQNARYRRDDNT